MSFFGFVKGGLTGSGPLPGQELCAECTPQHLCLDMGPRANAVRP